MAVRIALQCSEADAHLILSEDNTAARLLTRPGEAIYNDANGMIEGNNLFQVVWLSDERREEYLERIQEMCREQQHPQAAADRLRGEPAGRREQEPAARTACSTPPNGREPPKADSAWLGDAIAIKDPTAVVFRPQSGSNVLIVGQNDEAALAMMMMSAISIAAQHPPRRPARRAAVLPPRRQPGRLVARTASSASWPTSSRTRSRTSPGASSARRITELAAEIDPPAGATPPRTRSRSSSSSTTSSGSATSASRTTTSASRGYGEDKPDAAVEALRRRSSATARRWASTRSSGATASTT